MCMWHLVWIRDVFWTPETDTYYGEALAVVEAGESGAVEVAISDGERSDTVKIPIA